MNRTSGFTLAEVLITLGIIGIVAEITIPTLMQNMNEKQTVGMVKKEYSTLSQAFNMAVLNDGPPDGWGLSTTSFNDVDTMILFNHFVPYMKTIKKCGIDRGCLPDIPYIGLSNGTEDFDSTTDTAKLQLADGSIMFFRYWAGSYMGNTPSLSYVIGPVFVDINGFKKPNKLGVDVFRFLITKYGIIPSGTQQETADFKDGSDGCSTTGGTGRNCAAWVLYNENMDYLHCNNLSWSGPTKCQ